MEKYIITIIKTIISVISTMGSVISAIIGGFVGAFFNELFRNQPIFGLKFKIKNKNMEPRNVKVGLVVLKGIAKNIEWFIEYNNPLDNHYKDYFEYQRGLIDILKEGESRYLFSFGEDDYKNYKFYKYLKVVIKFKEIWRTKTVKLDLDLRKCLLFEDAVENEELVDLSSYLTQEAEKEFENEYGK